MCAKIARLLLGHTLRKVCPKSRKASLLYQDDDSARKAASALVNETTADGSPVSCHFFATYNLSLVKICPNSMISQRCAALASHLALVGLGGVGRQSSKTGTSTTYDPETMLPVQFLQKQLSLPGYIVVRYVSNIIGQRSTSKTAPDASSNSWHISLLGW